MRDERSSEQGCGRCGGPLSPRRRKWCSDNCCKRASADAQRAACGDCGEPLGEGSAYREYARCRACEKGVRARALRARLEDVAAMYHEGLSYRQIGEQLGYSGRCRPPDITYARQLGLIVGYRNRGYGEAA